jgi:hypothetical protein
MTSVPIPTDSLHLYYHYSDTSTKLPLVQQKPLYNNSINVIQKERLHKKIQPVLSDTSGQQLKSLSPEWRCFAEVLQDYLKINLINVKLWVEIHKNKSYMHF